MSKFILPAMLVMGSIFFAGCSKSGSDNKPDPNGNWKVTVVTGGHCLAPAASKIITVTGGQFSSTIVTYSNSAGTHTLSIQGTLTMGNIKFIVSGNETISGSGCNGTNGFYDYIDPSSNPVSGTVASNWGNLIFEKQ
jgi:hypothetical protein